MYVYFRLARVLAASCLIGSKMGSEHHSLDAVVSRAFRVLPSDIDFNGHLNNGRYLAFMDLGRIDLLAKSRLLWPLIKMRWRPVVLNISVSFRRSLRLFEPFTVETVFTSWVNDNFVLEQTFVKRDGMRAARAEVTIAFLAKSGKVLTSAIVEAMEEHQLPVPTILRPAAAELRRNLKV